MSNFYPKKYNDADLEGVLDTVAHNWFYEHIEPVKTEWINFLRGYDWESIRDSFQPETTSADDIELNYDKQKLSFIRQQYYIMLALKFLSEAQRERNNSSIL